MLNSGADINACCSKGCTSLVLALRSKTNLAMAKLLLSRPDLDLTIRADDGEFAWTPLYATCLFGRAEACQAIVDAGTPLPAEVVNEHHLNDHGGTPLSAAIR